MESILVASIAAGTVTTGIVIWVYKTFVPYREFMAYTKQSELNHKELVGIIKEAMNRL